MQLDNSIEFYANNIYISEILELEVRQIDYWHLQQGGFSFVTNCKSYTNSEINELERQMNMGARIVGENVDLKVTGLHIISVEVERPNGDISFELVDNVNVMFGNPIKIHAHFCAMQ